MIGRTNALVRALVSSVNGMSGVVILNANIIYDPSETYDPDTIGAELKNFITNESIDSLYGEVIPPSEEGTEDNENEIPDDANNDAEETSEEEEQTE